MPKNKSTSDYILVALSAIGAILAGLCATVLTPPADVAGGPSVLPWESTLPQVWYVNWNVVTFGLYGIGFFLVPILLIDMNFTVTTDRYHEFFGRFMGFLILLLCYTLKYVLDVSTAFKIGGIAACGCGLIGPTYAALYLSPKQTPAGHMPAHILFFLGGLLALACTI